MLSCLSWKSTNLRPKFKQNVFSANSQKQQNIHSRAFRVNISSCITRDLGWCGDEFQVRSCNIVRWTVICSCCLSEHFQLNSSPEALRVEHQVKSEPHPPLSCDKSICETCKLLCHFPPRPTKLMKWNESMDLFWLQPKLFCERKTCRMCQKQLACDEFRLKKDSWVVKHSVGTLAAAKLYDIDESSVSSAPSFFFLMNHVKSSPPDLNSKSAFVAPSSTLRTRKCHIVSAQFLLSSKSNHETSSPD